MSKKVFVCCPGDCVTGGPELMHQFVDALCHLGIDANIIYYPFDRDFFIPDPYFNYTVPVVKYNKDVVKDNIVVLPEVATGFVRFFPKSILVIWWLSVNNYSYEDKNDPAKKIKSIFKGNKLSLYAMKNYYHLAQSEYARLFLEAHGIQSMMLSDYLNEAHLNNNDGKKERENVIAYNPAKGIFVTQKLIINNPDFNFIPIVNMTPLQVKELLSESKVYIDFGSHPGKDRFPREAAMAGCCVVTGIQGSAKNDIDIPIPQKYKISEDDGNLNEKFRTLILSVFDDFYENEKNFESYRKVIREESANFKKQVASFVQCYCFV